MRHGTLLVFKSDMSEEAIAERLQKLVDEGILDVPEVVLVDSCPECGRQTAWYRPKCVKCGEKLPKRKFEGRDLVKEYDADSGSPVWYIP